MVSSVDMADDKDSTQIQNSDGTTVMEGSEKCFNGSVNQDHEIAMQEISNFNQCNRLEKNLYRNQQYQPAYTQSPLSTSSSTTLFYQDRNNGHQFMQQISVGEGDPNLSPLITASESEDHPPRSPSSSQPSLLPCVKLLDHNDDLPILMSYMQDRHCHLPLVFWNACQKYRHCQDVTQRKDLIESILATCFNSKISCPGLQARDQDEIRDKTLAGCFNSNLLDKFQEQVTSWIKREILPSFYQSHKFQLKQQQVHIISKTKSPVHHFGNLSPLPEEEIVISGVNNLDQLQTDSKGQQVENQKVSHPGSDVEGIPLVPSTTSL